MLIHYLLITIGAVILCEVIKLLIERYRQAETKLIKLYQLFSYFFGFIGIILYVYFTSGQEMALSEQTFVIAAQYGALTAFIYNLYQDWGLRGLLRWILKSIKEKKLADYKQITAKDVIAQAKDELIEKKVVSKETVSDVEKAIQVLVKEYGINNANYLTNYLKTFKK